MEPMSLWMCSCEVLPHFQQGPYCTACSCQAEVLSAAVVVLAISQVHSGVDALGRCRLWQHLLSSSPQGMGGLGTRGVTLMNGGGVTQHMVICCTISPLHHMDILDIGKCVCLLSEFKLCLFKDDWTHAPLQSNLPVIFSVRCELKCSTSLLLVEENDRWKAFSKKTSKKKKQT